MMLRVFSRRLLHSAHVTAPSTTASHRGAERRRPELDFDYLLDERNHEEIERNIRERKGIGNIQVVRSLWKEIEAIIDRRKEVVDENKYKELWDTLYEESLRIPNRTHPDVPHGSEEQAVVMETFGEKRESTGLFTAEKLVQSWRSLLHPNDACGQRSYVFVGPLARLEWSLIDFAFAHVRTLGFTPLLVPDLVPKEVGQACGVTDGMQYVLEDDPSTALSGTAEMGIAAMLTGNVFTEDQLPLRFVAKSRCFRPEISKSASEARLYRVHEFTKVEMFVVCAEGEGDRELEYLLSTQKDIWRALGLHCRVLSMPTEELGASAYRKYDIEAWMPGRGLFGEVSSTSNCTDYQSRRLGIRYRGKDGRLRFAHTCNGTALASTRALIALLETFQDEKRKGLLELPRVISDRMKTDKREQKIRFQLAKPFE